eukprot:5267206-Amphidinium_carterae.1
MAVDSEEIQGIDLEHAPDDLKGEGVPFHPDMATTQLHPHDRRHHHHHHDIIVVIIILVVIISSIKNNISTTTS